MKLSNFIPINRNLFRHYFWKEKRKYSKFEAWLDILQMVSYKDGNKQMINGMLCKWSRGQYPISISFLCTRWGWKDKPVRNYLKALESDQMVAIKRSNKWSILTVCKYETYNIEGQAEGSQEGNQRATKGQQLNKVNKEEIKSYIENDFKSIIKVYQTSSYKLTQLLCDFMLTQDDEYEYGASSKFLTIDTALKDRYKHFVNYLRKLDVPKRERILEDHEVR